CWGANPSGQLGDGSTAERDGPVTPVGLSDVAQLAAGLATTCARRTNGEVRCWGAMTVGTTDAVPTTVPGASPAGDVAVGDAHVCVRRAGGEVLCWGNNDSAQLGRGWNAQGSSPGVVPGLRDAVGLVAGPHHTCVLRATGAMVCWGTGFHPGPPEV